MKQLLYFSKQIILLISLLLCNTALSDNHFTIIDIGQEPRESFEYLSKSGTYTFEAIIAVHSITHVGNKDKESIAATTRIRMPMTLDIQGSETTKGPSRPPRTLGILSEKTQDYTEISSSLQDGEILNDSLAYMREQFAEALPDSYYSPTLLPTERYYVSEQMDLMWGFQFPEVAVGKQAEWKIHYRTIGDTLTREIFNHLTLLESSDTMKLQFEVRKEIDDQVIEVPDTFPEIDILVKSFSATSSGRMWVDKNDGVPTFISNSTTY